MCPPTSSDLRATPNPALAAKVASRLDIPANEVCVICLSVVRVMAFKGSGVCGETHRKVRDGEPDQPNALEF